MQCERSPNEKTAFLVGCLDKGVETIQKQAAIVGGVGIGIAFLMVIQFMKFDKSRPQSLCINPTGYRRKSIIQYKSFYWIIPATIAPSLNWAKQKQSGSWK